MTRIFMWRADSAGCGAYRVRWPADALKEHYGSEIEIRHDTVLTKADRDWDPDVIVGQRVVLPGPSAMWHEWRRQGKVLVTELDDDLWSIPEQNWKASKIFNTTGIRRRLQENIEVSDYVTVSTEALKETAHRNTGFPKDRIFVVANSLPRGLVVDKVPDPESFRFDIGYLASPTHDADWKMVQRHVKRVLENDETLTFATVGAAYSKSLALPSQTFHMSWTESPEQAIESIDYGLSIAPLLAGTFNRSKSDCKWLEASARGTPSVVSDVTAYGPVTDNVTGVKVAREHEWGRVLGRLVSSPDERYRLAVAAHAEVSEHRTTDVTAALWRDVLLRGPA